MAEIKRKEREKGKRAALQAADNAAKELGYSSHEDMITKLKAKRTPQAPVNRPVAAAPAAETDDAPTQTSRRTTKQDREIARLQEQRRSANRARAAAERKLREQQRAAEARDAEHELRVAAARHGVKDVDYALVLLQRKLKGMPEKDLAAFDEDVFFSTELRKTNPYVYGEEVQPATTSPEGTSKVTPKTPTTPTPPNGQQKDARAMSKSEYEQTLRQRGFTPPHLGTPG